MKKIQKRILTDDRLNVERVGYVHVYITKQCNLTCRHCYTNSSPDEKFMLPLDFWLDVFGQLNDLGVRTIHIEGGEPLLFPKIEEIIKFISSSSRIKELLIVSNGIVATKERLKALMDAGLKKIAISLDSLNGDIHNELRNPSHKFAMQAIKDALDTGLYTRVSTVINRKNIGDMGNFINYLSDLGVNTINLDWFNGAGRGYDLRGEFQVTERDEELLRGFEDSVSEFVMNRSKSGTILSIDLPQWYERRDSFLVSDPVATHFLECDAIRKQLSIDEKGNVLPCFIYSGGPESIGSLRTLTMEDIIYDRLRHLPVGCPIGVRKHIFYQSGKLDE